MEIKRNIFESRGKMPGTYEPVASAMCPEDMPMNFAGMPGRETTNNHVQHARSPRVGEQK